MPGPRGRVGITGLLGGGRAEGQQTDQSGHINSLQQSPAPDPGGFASTAIRAELNLIPGRSAAATVIFRRKRAAVCRPDSPVALLIAIKTMTYESCRLCTVYRIARQHAETVNRVTLRRSAGGPGLVMRTTDSRNVARGDVAAADPLATLTSADVSSMCAGILMHHDPNSATAFGAPYE